MKGIPAKLRAITDPYLFSKGIDVMVLPISILDEDFESEIRKHPRTCTKAAEVERAIRHHIEVDMGDDPDLQASFAEALGAILQAFKDNWEQIFEELERLRLRIMNASGEPTFGLHRKKQMPFFRRLKQEIYDHEELSDDEISMLVDLTQRVFLTVERELRLTGFWESIPARNKLSADLQKILVSEPFVSIPGVAKNRRRIIARILEVAEKNDDIIKYAA